MLNNNKSLKLNMVRDNYDNFDFNCQLAMGMMEAQDRATNKLQTMNAIMVKFEELEFYHLEFFTMMYKFIVEKYVYELAIVINEKEKMFFLCDHKYHMSQKQFKKIYKDLLKNLNTIEDTTTKICSALLFVKSKQEIESLCEEIMKSIKNSSIDVKRGC